MFPIRDHNPPRRLPLVTWALIAMNVLVFVSYFGLFADERALMRFFMHWGLVPARLSAGEGFETLITSQFLHAGVVHLGMNMLFLWIFGDNMEDVLGHWRFLGYYLLCGAAAAGMQYLAGPDSRIPMVGASGAVAGVLGGYVLMFPRARVDVLIFLIVYIRVVPMPAWFVLGLWFLLQLLGGVSAPADAGGVAYWAHAGGFVAGMVLMAPAWLARGGTAFWAKTLGAPPHPEARYRFGRSSIPRAGRRRLRSPWARRGKRGPTDH